MIYKLHAEIYKVGSVFSAAPLLYTCVPNFAGNGGNKMLRTYQPKTETERMRFPRPYIRWPKVLAAEGLGAGASDALILPTKAPCRPVFACRCCFIWETALRRRKTIKDPLSQRGQLCYLRLRREKYPA